MMFNGIWAAMLNKRAKNGSQKVLENLNINVGDTIADIGSGGGFFSFEMAKRIGPEGNVFAVDTNEALLACINKAARKMQFRNIETVIASEKSANLPKNSCDLIFMRNVFHHIKNPVSYFNNLGESIKPNGRIAILDWKNTEGGFVGRSGHCTPEAEILGIMEKAGLSHFQSFDFLPGQSFNVFDKIEIINET